MAEEENANVELDDDGNEIVKEAHNPANAPAENTAAIKAAEKKGKGKAPDNKPKGAGSEPAEKVPSKKEKSGLKDAKEDVNFEEDLNALVESEATLSDGFKGKAAVIFEAALKSTLAEEVEKLEENYNNQLEEAKAEFTDKIDSYLNYVVENWMKENEIAIQTGLRAEIAENFMSGLKDLFTENYIEVPESKIDLVDGLVEQYDELEERHNAQTEQFIQMSESLQEYQRYEVIRESASGMADTDVERLTALVADIDFEDEETFTSKVKTVKESYFKKDKSITENTNELNEDNSGSDEEVENDPRMQSYLAALKAQN